MPTYRLANGVPTALRDGPTILEDRERRRGCRVVSEYFGWASLTLLGASLVLFTLGIRRRSRAEPILCPGPRRGLAAWLWPGRWFFRSACAYNLTGLPQGEQGAVRCPECGAVSRPAERLRSACRWRPAAFGVLCLGLSAACIGVPWWQTGGWASLVPTPVLVGFERLSPAWQPRALRRELYRRGTAGRVHGLSARWLAPKLARDLRDDTVRGNAERAEALLDALWPESRAALETSLSAGDRQARLIAAGILRVRCPADPCDALLAACVEDLRDDVTRVEFWTLWNACSAVEYLCRFPRRVARLLRPALESDDPQQRMLAAAVAGSAGITALLDQAAPILIEQLRDDGIPGNAKVAVPALYRFGPAVISYLEPCCDSEDRQLRLLARAIIERLRFPSRALDQLETPIPWITEVTNDPLRHLSIANGVRDLP